MPTKLSERYATDPAPLPLGGDELIEVTIPGSAPYTAITTSQDIADLPPTAPMPVANGGTGSTTASAARTALGLGTLATQSGTFSGTSSGTNTGDQTITLTGNVTGSGTGSFAATIANDAVTYAKMQNVSATDKLLGRSTAGAGDVEEITCTAAGRALIDDADAAAQRTTLGLGTVATLASDTDTTLATNSDARVATQKAVKAYVDNAVTGLWDMKGSTDTSANPNYPAASKGDAYAVSVAGKIGGASGTPVDVGDVYVALADNAGGTEAAVGSSWMHIEHNLSGVALTSGTLAQFAATTSAQLAGVLSDETGSGAAVFANTPTLVTPVLGAATGTSVVLSSTATASALIPSGSTVPANGVYLPAANSVGIASNSVSRLIADSTGQINTSGAVRAQGGVTSTAGSGAELEYASGEGYLSAYNRTGGAWLPMSVRGSTVSLYFGGALGLSLNASGHFTPGTDNTQNFGSAPLRFKEIFAGTAIINTSDAREKTTVTPMTDSEVAAATQLSREIGSYQWLAAVEKKGRSTARQHIGMTVQRAIQVMTANGLDPMRYGFICYDKWETGDRYSFRTDELLLFLARGFDARLSVLEKKAKA